VESSRSGRAAGIRRAALEVTREAARALGFEPQVRFVGAVDTLIDDATASDLLATLREALSNVARHAHAGRVEVEITANKAVLLCVRDNGAGIDISAVGARAGHGLRNMHARAEQRGGYLRLELSEGGGTVLQWWAPLPT
jgi:signal transduction histidine kinase